MAEEKTIEQESSEKEEEEKTPKKKKKFGKRFKKIPKGVLFSPGGVILLFFALIMEIVDLLIPVSGVDSIVIELIPEIFFAFMLKIITGIPLSANIVPFLIERIPLISDILPTWFIRLFF